MAVKKLTEIFALLEKTFFGFQNYSFDCLPS